MFDKKCDHYWTESEFLPVNAALDYWCGNNPVCREAKKFAIIAACERGEIEYARTDGKDFNDPVLELIGKRVLVIHRESFERWAKKIDATVDLHLPTKASYLNPGHQFHAKELKVSVEAWTLLYEKNPPNGKPKGGHKKYILDWLEENYPDLGSNARERIAIIINPNPQGGSSPSEPRW
jgi:hypothetical protein